MTAAPKDSPAIKDEPVELSPPPIIARKPAMGHIRDLIRSGLIHVALALGFSIIVFAWFSKRVLPEPIPNLYLAIPGFLALGYETVDQMTGKKRIPEPLTRSFYWVVAILLSTLFIILLHWN
jgi:hypothetical protein